MSTQRSALSGMLWGSKKGIWNSAKSESFQK